MPHEQSIVANGTKFRILIDGSPERPWLTCLHSLATRSELWDDQLGVLTEHFQVLRIDARGHGGSPPSAKPFGIEDLASDVVAIWDLVGVRESAVLGLSLGGMTALGLALDHGPRVTRMVAAQARVNGETEDLGDQRLHPVGQGLGAALDQSFDKLNDVAPMD